MKRNSILLLICVLVLTPSVLDASETETLYQKAMALSDSVSIKKQINAFKDVIKQDETFAPAHNQLAWLYIKQNRPSTRQRAKRSIDRAIELDPDNLAYQLTKGSLLWAQGYHQNAVAHYEEMIKKHPGSADALHWLGFYYAHQFLDDKDRQGVAAVGATVGFEYGSFNMGKVDRNSRRSDLTFAHLDSRVRAAGFGKINFTSQAISSRTLALLYLRKTLELRPGFRDALYQVGLIHLESGRPDRLVETMGFLLDQQPDDKDALLFTGLGYLAQGLPGRANQNFEKALLMMVPEERAVLEDVTLIASKDERRQLASLEPVATDEWTDTTEQMQFWRKQDPLFLTQYNERRLEHYARLAYANLRYSQPLRQVEGWTTNPGQTYIKFGRYRKRIVNGDMYGMTETWIYEGFNLDFRSTPKQGLGGRIFNWRAGYQVPLARPYMRDPWADINDQIAIERGRMTEYEASQRQRFREDARSYRYLPDSFPPSTKEVFKKTPSRYVDPYKTQRYTLPHLITAFQERDSVRLEIAYAVPKRRAQSLLDDGAGIIDGVFLFDHDWNEMYRNPQLVTRSDKDGDFQKETTDSLRQEYVNVEHTLYVKPGQYHVAAEVLDRKTFAIGSFRETYASEETTDDFAMSDVLLASDVMPNVEFPETRRDLDITPNPLRTFQNTQPMFIYLEMYNLKENAFGRTKYEISYRIGRPKEEEIDPSLFFDVDLPEGEIEITLVDQPEPEPILDGDDGFGGTPQPRAPGYEVTYKASERNLVTEWIKKNVRGLFKKKHETTITAQYEGDRSDDFTYLQIDLSNVAVGVHKLTITTRDLISNDEMEREVLFRIVN